MEDDGHTIDGELISDMRVVDLKRHLDARGLSKSGTKPQLVERLKARIQLEKEQTQSNSDSQNEDIGESDRLVKVESEKPFGVEMTRRRSGRQHGVKTSVDEAEQESGRSLRRSGQKADKSPVKDSPVTDGVIGQHSTALLDIQVNESISRESDNNGHDDSSDTEPEGLDIPQLVKNKAGNQESLCDNEQAGHSEHTKGSEKVTAVYMSCTYEANEKDDVDKENVIDSDTKMIKQMNEHSVELSLKDKVKSPGEEVDARMLRLGESQEDEKGRSFSAFCSGSCSSDKAERGEVMHGIMTNRNREGGTWQNDANADCMGIDDSDSNKKQAEIKQNIGFKHEMEIMDNEETANLSCEIDNNMAQKSILSDVNQADSKKKMSQGISNPHDSIEMSQSRCDSGRNVSQSSQSSNALIRSLEVDEDMEELDYDETMEGNENSRIRSQSDSEVNHKEAISINDSTECVSTEEGEIVIDESKTKDKSRSQQSSKSHHAFKDKSRKGSNSPSRKWHCMSLKYDGTSQSLSENFRRSPIRAPSPKMERRVVEKGANKDTRTPQYTDKHNITKAGPGKTLRHISRRTSYTDKEGEETSGKKRKWGASSKSTTRTADRDYNIISTESLKGLIPAITPTPFTQELPIDIPDSPLSEIDVENEDRRDVKIKRVITQNVETTKKPLEEGDRTDELREMREDLRVTNVREVDDTTKVKDISDEANKTIKDEVNKGRTHVTDPVIVKRTVAHPTAKTAPLIVLETDVPKAARRTPSPPRHPKDCVIHVTNLTRPFTLVQLKELFRRTGTIADNQFWIDRIKSHCFIMYETVEQAVATRNALHGTKWPLSNPKNLRVDFSSVSELQRYRNTEGGLESDVITRKPKLEKTALSLRTCDRVMGRTEKEKQREGKRGERIHGDERGRRNTKRHDGERDKSREDHSIEGRKKSERRHDDGSQSDKDGIRSERRDEKKEADELKRRAEAPVREWDIGKVRSGSKERSISRDQWLRARKTSDSEEQTRNRYRDDRDGKEQQYYDHDEERQSRRKDEEKGRDEPPAKLLDDLFKKTKSTPCIYWLPLTDEQIAEKFSQKSKLKLVYKTEAEYLQEEMGPGPFPLDLGPPPMGMPIPPMLLGPPMGPPSFFQHDRRDGMPNHRQRDREQRRGRYSRSKSRNRRR